MRKLVPPLLPRERSGYDVIDLSLVLNDSEKERWFSVEVNQLVALGLSCTLSQCFLNNLVFILSLLRLKLLPEVNL